MIAGLLMLAYAAALRFAALARRGFRKPPSRHQVARNFRRVAKRADPAALEDFRFARRQFNKEDRL
jgi:hypothetical protein